MNSMKHFLHQSENPCMFHCRSHIVLKCSKKLIKCFIYITIHCTSICYKHNIFPEYMYTYFSFDTLARARVLLFKLLNIEILQVAPLLKPACLADYIKYHPFYEKHSYRYFAITIIVGKSVFKAV